MGELTLLWWDFYSKKTMLEVEGVKANALGRVIGSTQNLEMVGTELIAKDEIL